MITAIFGHEVKVSDSFHGKCLHMHVNASCYIMITNEEGDDLPVNGEPFGVGLYAYTDNDDDFISYETDYGYYPQHDLVARTIDEAYQIFSEMCNL